MSAIDRETTVPRVAGMLKNDAQRRMIIAAVRDGAMKSETAYALIDRQVYGEMRPDELETMVALGRRHGAEWLRRRFNQGGIAGMRQRGDLEGFAKTLAAEAQSIEKAAKGNAEVQARMGQDLFLRTFGRF